MIINLDMLREVERALGLVHRELGAAERLTEDWRSVVGHRTLESRLDDFSGNWDDTRRSMLEGIERMGRLAGEIAQAFEDVDAELARALQGDR